MHFCFIILMTKKYKDSRRSGSSKAMENLRDAGIIHPALYLRNCFFIQLISLIGRCLIPRLLSNTFSRSSSKQYPRNEIRGCTESLQCHRDTHVGVTEIGKIVGPAFAPLTTERLPQTAGTVYGYPVV